MEQNNQKAALQVRDLSVTFSLGKKLFGPSSKLHAVNGVSLDVFRGEFLSIVGESGCGKSTFAKVLLGLQKPTSGAIDLNGRPLASYSRLEIARQIQPVFQDPYSSLNPRKSVAANVALPLIVGKGEGSADIRGSVQKALDLVGLSRKHAGAYPNQLSGGQRQRVAIARALITRPGILICDEPTSALDVSVQAQILNLLQNLGRELNITCIFISHDLSVVKHMSKRVAVMYLGRIVELGAAEDVFNRPRHPYTKMLIGSILPADPGKKLSIPTNDGGFPDPTNPPPGCHFSPRCDQAMEVCSKVKPDLLRDEAVEVACHLYSGTSTQRLAS